ncbi:hypothetical protein KM295_16095 [Natronomonas sp. F2-12]|uniref:DUF8130 domain-containing protein n=1 Tax=Natronomonas aquatica TaxID=2841590 RepID=A0A9R1CTC3_9EURY|nr:hypothetical protein [Natronomonas aquatica]MCQ4334973.1 hypothetical protein [Natronomonas aquatica]
MQRRTFLSSIGTGTLSLAGCVDSLGSDDSNESTNQDQESISTNDLTFDVSIEEHFTETHPARIHVTLTNTLETQVILSTGATPPFTSYVSGSKSDETRLVLVPDVSEAESPLDWIGETNPIPTSAENGCWNVTQDVQIEEIGAEIKLEQGESSSQRYDIYGYQNDSCPSPGAYPFEDTLGAFRGQLSDDTTEHEVALGFTVTLDEDQSLSVEKDDPAVTTAED